MMGEKTTTVSDYKIGHLRIKYLDLANISFAQNDFIRANGYIKNFLDTVDDKSEAGRIIKEEFDKIILRKKREIESLESTLKNLGYLEQKDFETKGRAEIEINAIHDMKEVCWRISLEHGLFNE